MEEDKSQKVVETNKAVAAGIASVVTAVFTSKLGVAGTLIGTALTATLITLISAVLKAQLMKAADTISGLPNTVQGRLSTQQIRIPGKPGPEPNPEPAARPGAARGGRLSGLLSRLRAVPGFLRGLPSVQRRKVLLAGVLAGLAATVIGLVAITGVEFVAGNTLSCLVWSCPEDGTASAKSSDRSGLSILGGYSPSGYSSPDTRSAPSGAPSDNPPGEQPFAPKNGQQFPQQRQPAGQPAQPDANEGAPQQQQQPDENPRSVDQVRQQPEGEPGSDEGGYSASPSEEKQSPPQEPPQRGQSQEKGAQKEDRG
jgi:hypothetical protein